MLILLIGPILEEKYGGKRLLIMILATGLLTGVLVVLFNRGPLLGASGIAFMLIVLSSISNAKDGSIPLTFILIMVLYIGNEFLNSLKGDVISQQTSQFAHIIGGLCGAVFGFAFNKENDTLKSDKKLA